jgi:phosphoribosylpyrophosphate synthetase
LIGKDRTADGLGTASTVEQTLISGDLTDKRVLICDDILGSGESLNNAYQIASEEHAKEVILYVTHSVNYKDYYNTIQGVLMNDKVRAIISTDSLPTEGRYMGGTSIPKTEDGSKAVTILPVAESLAKVARTIVESPTYDEAIDLLEDYICPLYDPKELAQTVFGVTPIKRRDVGIYTRSKNYVLFEDLL